MALSAYERTLKSYRRDLLAEDARVKASLDAAYRDAKNQIERDLKRAVAELSEMPSESMFDRRGRFTDAGQVQWRRDRLMSLSAQVDDELARLAAQSDALITNGQRTTARLGAQQAAGLVEAQAPGLAASFNRLPVSAIENMVGTLSDGSPLRSLLNQQGLAAGDEARRILTNAIAIGKGPREVARELRRVLNGSRWGAETLARNALLDSHRLASLQSYARNSDILQGWTWVAALSSRTCLACVSLHGKSFPLTEQFFPRHVRCRCSPAPALRDEFGAPPPFEAGDRWLDRQSVEAQRKMIPKALWSDYQSGAIQLDDFVTEAHSSRWGRSFRQATVTEAREHAARRGRRAAA